MSEENEQTMTQDAAEPEIDDVDLTPDDNAWMEALGVTGQEGEPDVEQEAQTPEAGSQDEGEGASPGEGSEVPVEAEEGAVPAVEVDDEGNVTMSQDQFDGLMEQVNRQAEAQLAGLQPPPQAAEPPPGPSPLQTPQVPEMEIDPQLAEDAGITSMAAFNQIMAARDQQLAAHITGQLVQVVGAQTQAGVLAQFEAHREIERFVKANPGFEETVEKLPAVALTALQDVRMQNPGMSNQEVLGEVQRRMQWAIGFQKKVQASQAGGKTVDVRPAAGASIKGGNVGTRSGKPVPKRPMTANEEALALMAESGEREYD